MSSEMAVYEQRFTQGGRGGTVPKYLALLRLVEVLGVNHPSD